ncbi:COG4705 family protein [Williamsia sp. M5A3_1d]
MHQRPVTSSPRFTKALSKVPEVTIFFWVIKILATTVGETAADYMNMTMGFGLTNTTIVTVVILVVSLAGQFAVRRYIPVLYWWIVVVISVTGTLITDNLTDNFGVPLVATTIVFAAVLIAVFTAWYVVEGTLSIHSIRTPRREAFYWLAILFTFALGTAAGDLIAEKLALGYTWSLVLFAGLIAVITLGHYGLRVNAVTAFWAAYIITRPLGASLGDLLTQPTDSGGLGLGTTGVNLAFFGVIIALVAYLTVTRVDRLEQNGSTGMVRETAAP